MNSHKNALLTPRGPEHLVKNIALQCRTARSPSSALRTRNMATAAADMTELMTDLHTDTDFSMAPPFGGAQGNRIAG